jgi:hypothetical protein
MGTRLNLFRMEGVKAFFCVERRIVMVLNRNKTQDKFNNKLINLT